MVVSEGGDGIARRVSDEAIPAENKDYFAPLAMTLQRNLMAFPHRPVPFSLFPFYVALLTYSQTSLTVLDRVAPPECSMP